MFFYVQSIPKEIQLGRIVCFTRGTPPLSLQPVLIKIDLYKMYDVPIVTETSSTIPCPFIGAHDT